VAIIFVAPVSSAEHVVAWFATGFREDKEQKDDQNGHDHGDQPLLSHPAFLSFTPASPL
jgi:hypothetical protein